MIFCVSLPFAGAEGNPLKIVKGENFVNSLKMTLIWLDGGFWASATETTQGEYEKIMADNPSRFLGATQPVQRCGWSAANEFCRRLTAQEEQNVPAGWSYRLPSEQEWQALVMQARLDSGKQSATGPVSVDSLAADPRGFKGVLGNVWEWCSDYYDDKRQEFVVRGGAWDSRMAAADLTKHRGFSPALVGRGNDGFRVFLAPDPGVRKP